MRWFHMYLCRQDNYICLYAFAIFTIDLTIFDECYFDWLSNCIRPRSTFGHSKQMLVFHVSINVYIVSYFDEVFFSLVLNNRFFWTIPNLKRRNITQHNSLKPE